MKAERIEAPKRRGRAFLLYPLWILLCAVAFVALRGAPDPALPAGRLSEREAIIRASAVLAGDPRFRSHQAVHAAWSSAGELGEEARWLILFRLSEAPRLHDAVVVELGGENGRLLRMRGLPN